MEKAEVQNAYISSKGGYVNNWDCTETFNCTGPEECSYLKDKPIEFKWQDYNCIARRKGVDTYVTLYIAGEYKDTVILKSESIPTITPASAPGKKT